MDIPQEDKNKNFNALLRSSIFEGVEIYIGKYLALGIPIRLFHPIESNIVSSHKNKEL